MVPQGRVTQGKQLLAETQLEGKVTLSAVGIRLVLQAGGQRGCRNCRSSQAGCRLVGVLVVCDGDCYLDGFALLGGLEDVPGTRCAADGDVVGQPLVAEAGIIHPVGNGYGGCICRKHMANLDRSVDGRNAGHGGALLERRRRNSRRGRAGQRFKMARVIGKTHRDKEHLVDIGGDKFKIGRVRRNVNSAAAIGVPHVTKTGVGNPVGVGNS